MSRGNSLMVFGNILPLDPPEAFIEDFSPDDFLNPLDLIRKIIILRRYHLISHNHMFDSWWGSIFLIGH